MEIQCKRCGRCCHHSENGVITPCRFLVRLSNGKTYCKVYQRRLGIKTHGNSHCDLRGNCESDFIDCPFNTNKKIRDVGY